MNGTTHQKGRDTATLIMLPYTISMISGMGYNLVEKIGIGVISILITHSVNQLGTHFPDFDQNENALPVPHKDHVDENWRKLYYDFCLATHKWLKGFGATHRSWHTHTVSHYILTGVVPAFLILAFLYREKTDIIYFFLHLIFLGWGISGSMHVILDMFNFKGARWVPFQRRATNLLPNQIKIPLFFWYHRKRKKGKRFRIYGPMPFKYLGKLYFETMGKTGGDYEAWFQRWLNRLNIICFFSFLIVSVLSMFDVNALSFLKLFFNYVTSYDYGPMLQRAEEVVSNISRK